ncbi:perlucin-like protein [Mizuhopecten yessoensis]|uniref:perlucin-like protein n=1 Tax=Mizuhopecten yessoensis TaxID=6573 RepID=UPI000B45E9EC|nr:perlucin-like protein [Mizuhopecten yessoensis]
MFILFGVLPLLLRLVIISSGVQSQNVTCQQGWTGYGSHCYWSQPGLKKSWEYAQTICQSHESNLVKVETLEENLWLKTFATLSDYPWIGANDREKEGDWRWISDNSTVEFSDWGRAEPSNTGGNEHCAQIITQWNDQVCTMPYGIICEKEG